MPSEVGANEEEVNNEEQTSNKRKEPSDGEKEQSSNKRIDQSYNEGDVPSPEKNELSPPQNGKDQSTESNEEQKEMSVQEKSARKIQLAKQAESLQHCLHVLRVLTRSQKGPEFWGRDDLKGIRECLQVIKSQPDRFPAKFGDKLPDGSIFSGGGEGNLNIPAITASYISSIAFQVSGFC